MADSDVFTTPVTVNSCAAGNEGRDGEGLVSFARSLVRVIGSMVIVISGAAIQLAALPSKSLRCRLLSSLVFRSHRNACGRKALPAGQKDVG
jgi:hypothetical protein